MEKLKQDVRKKSHSATHETHQALPNAKRKKGEKTRKRKVAQAMQSREYLLRRKRVTHFEQSFGIEALRDGDKPPVESWCEEYPGLKDHIEGLFPVEESLFAVSHRRIAEAITSLLVDTPGARGFLDRLLFRQLYSLSRYGRFSSFKELTNSTHQDQNLAVPSCEGALEHCRTICDGLFRNRPKGHIAAGRYLVECFALDRRGIVQIILERLLKHRERLHKAGSDWRINAAIIRRLDTPRGSGAVRPPNQSIKGTHHEAAAILADSKNSGSRDGSTGKANAANHTTTQIDSILRRVRRFKAEISPLRPRQKRRPRARPPSS